MRSLVVVCVLLSACIETNTVTCADGLVCPAGTTCQADTGRCISEPQRAACEGLPDDASCAIAGTLGRCRDQVCETFVCGNEVREGTERCDGADLAETCATLGYYAETSALGCTADCQFDVSGCARTCGDGLVDPEEQCDGTALGLATDCTSLGFYEPAGLACAPSCTWKFDQCAGYCGDGATNGPEVCDGAAPAETCTDFGFDAGRSGCSSSCGASFEHCGRFGWRPQATGAPTILGFYAGADQQWVVGPGGYIARLVAGTWQQTPAPISDDLTRVWAASGRAWASARSPGALLAWNGATWQAVPGAPAATFTDVWAVGATAFVATTTSGILSWDGTSWGTVGSLGCSAVVIRGTSATDLWAGCSSGLHRWTGVTWTPMRTGATHDLVLLDPETVVAVGHVGDLTTPYVIAIRDQGTWTEVEVRFRCNAIGATALNDIWCGTASGTVLHFNGQRAMTDDLTAGSAASVIGLSMLGPGLWIAATTDGLSFRFRGQLLADRGPAIGVGGAVDVWTDGSDERFVVTLSGNVVRGEFGWASLNLAGNPLTSVWGAARDDVWAGSRDGTLFHYDGTSWEAALDMLGRIHAIFGTSASDVWVLANAGPRHFDGTGWETRPTLSADVLTVGASTSAGEIWASSTVTRKLYRWTGAWSEVTTFPAAPTSISAPRSDLVYVAAGFRGVHFFDGVTWQDLSLPTSLPIIRVVAFAPDDVFAASRSELVHFDGTAWSPVRVPLGGVEELVTIKGTRGRLEILTTSPNELRALSLIRIQPWVCRPIETDCSDSIDDDCDGVIDDYDSDCP